MKRMMIGALLFVVIAGLAGFAALSASEKTDTPREVADTMFEALTRQDASAFTATFCEQQLASLVYASAYQSGAAPTLTYRTTNITGDKAVLIVAGFAQPNPLDWEIHLEKQGKNWCIVGLESVTQ